MSTSSLDAPARLQTASALARALPARIGQALFVLWAAFTLSFLILYALPSDPVSIMLS